MMVAQPEGGVIVTIGDWAIKRPYPDRAAYFLSKGAIPTAGPSEFGTMTVTPAEMLRAEILVTTQECP